MSGGANGHADAAQAVDAARKLINKQARGGGAMSGANGYQQVTAKQAQRRPRGKDEFGNYRAKIDAYEAAKALGPVVAPALAWLANRGWFLHLDGALWQRDEREGADKLIAGRPELDMCSLGTSRAAIMAELRAEISMDPALFDADPDVCGLPNGRLLDLASGQVREPRMEQVVIDLVHRMVRAEHITRCLPVLPMYHPRDGAVLFEDVLRHTVRHLTEPDAVTAWIRWWLRYALGGRCNDESLLFLYGLPGTGKSTVADTVAAMAGDYADTVSAERLVGDGSQHRQWLARLEGARLVRCNELPRNGGAWRTEDLLALVSGETLEANRMRAGSFTFRSQAKLLLTDNSAPSAPTDSGIWRRLRIVPCDSTPERVDEGLKDRLREPEHLAAMLGWVLTAPTEQPPVPAEMRLAVEEQRGESNPCEQWIEENLAPDLSTGLSFADIFAAYRNTASVDGVTQHAFGRALTKAGLKTYSDRSTGKTVKMRHCRWQQQ